MPTNKTASSTVHAPKKKGRPRKEPPKPTRNFGQAQITLASAKRIHNAYNSGRGNDKKEIMKIEHCTICNDQYLLENINKLLVCGYTEESITASALEEGYQLEAGLIKHHRHFHLTEFDKRVIELIDQNAVEESSTVNRLTARAMLDVITLIGYQNIVTGKSKVENRDLIAVEKLKQDREKLEMEKERIQLENKGISDAIKEVNSIVEALQESGIEKEKIRDILLSARNKKLKADGLA